MPQIKNHPHKYTLDLLKIVIDRLPVTAPDTIREAAHTALDKYSADPKIEAADIEAKIAEIGKQTWGPRKSYDELFQKYGLERQEELFRAELRPDVREKYLKWIKEGHRFHDVRRTADFEQAFTSDERFAMEEALLSAEESARGEVDELILGEKKSEYEERLKIWQEKQQVLDEKLQLLRAMAHESPKWSAEILDKVRLLEEGWSVVERDTDIYEVDKEIEYWRGVIEVA